MVIDMMRQQEPELTWLCLDCAEPGALGENEFDACIDKAWGTDAEGQPIGALLVFTPALPLQSWFRRFSLLFLRFLCPNFDLSGGRPGLPLRGGIGGDAPARLCHGHGDPPGPASQHQSEGAFEYSVLFGLRNLNSKVFQGFSLKR